MSTTEETGRAQQGAADRQGPGGPAGAMHEAAATAQAKAQETAAELARKGTGALRTKIDERTGEASRQSRSLAESLRRSSGEARQQGNTMAANATDMAAQRLDQVAGYLEHADGDTILRDAGQLARRQPWAVAGVGMMAGLAVARMVKVSAAERREGEGRGQGGYGQGQGQARYGQDAGYGNGGYAPESPWASESTGAGASGRPGPQ